MMSSTESSLSVVSTSILNVTDNVLIFLLFYCFCCKYNKKNWDNQILSHFFFKFPPQCHLSLRCRFRDIQRFHEDFVKISTFSKISMFSCSPLNQCQMSHLILPKTKSRFCSHEKSELSDLGRI